jgi:transcriptional regulator GlxA family with amidase domain
LKKLQDLDRNTRVVEKRRFVDNGTIVTAAGVSAGIDASLHVVHRMLGEEVAERTARAIEYSWTPEPPRAKQSPDGEARRPVPSRRGPAPRRLGAGSCTVLREDGEQEL